MYAGQFLKNYLQGNSDMQQENKENTKNRTRKGRRARQADAITNLTSVAISETQKPTQTQKEARVGLVMELLLKGMHAKSILQYFAEQGIDISIRTVHNYIDEANQRYKEISRVDSEAEFNKQKARLEFLYNQLTEQKAYKDALPVLKEISALQGISNSENGDMVSRKDLVRIMNQMSTIVTHFVHDQEILAQIRAGWANMTLV